VDNTPNVVRGVAEALRRGQPEELDALWTVPAKAHAQKRLQRHMFVGDLAREYQNLCEETWRALRPYLAVVPAEEVYAIAESPDAALATMAPIAGGSYGAERSAPRSAPPVCSGSPPP
jgi:hypothetical protein